jgi:hypothetical protein
MSGIPEYFFLSFFPAFDNPKNDCSIRPRFLKSHCIFSFLIAADREVDEDYCYYYCYYDIYYCSSYCYCETIEELKGEKSIYAIF